MDHLGQRRGSTCFLFPVNILIADNDIGITGYFTKNSETTLRIGVHFISIRLPFRIYVGFKSRYSIIGYENSLETAICSLGQLPGCFIESLLHNNFHKEFQTLSNFPAGCAFIFKMGLPAVIMVLNSFPSFFYGYYESFYKKDPSIIIIIFLKQGRPAHGVKTFALDRIDM